MQFEVLPATYSGDVWLRGHIEGETVKIIASREMLETAAGRGSLSENQLVVLAKANAAALTEAGLAMFSDQQDKLGQDGREVVIPIDGPTRYRPDLSTSVLQAAFRWADPKTGQ